MADGRPLVMVTGGAGFIGSHTHVALVAAGYDTVVVDNLSNASAVSVERSAEVASRAPIFVQADLRDRAALDEVFRSYPIDSIIHFAAYKAVGESVEKPMKYYDNNIGATVALLKAMRDHGVHRLVFSSSCSVYGATDRCPIDESTPHSPTNPYSYTKHVCERILDDVAVRFPDWNIVSLRYFNPVGGHPSGRMGEDPRGIPNNLMPYVMQVAVGRLPRLRVFGDDYPTADGTGVRDYVHVMDLAEAHVAAVQHLGDAPGHRIYNIGTGRGSTVLEVVEAFRRASGRDIPYEVVARRAGDVAQLVCDGSLAARELGWTAKRDLDDMCRDAWAFQRDNPNGYEG